MKRNLSSKRGVTLILVAGVLAILAALGAGFYTMTLMQLTAATHYNDSVRAEMMAKAGLYDAISRLRDLALKKTEDPADPWYMVDYLHGAARGVSFAEKVIPSSSIPPEKYSYSHSLTSSIESRSDRYSLRVSDAASKININACDNLAVLLDNLCRVIGPPLVPADQDALLPRRWADLGAPNYANDKNKNDTAQQGAAYFMPTKTDRQHIDDSQPPARNADGSALYGDGYAIARYRAVHGRFLSITDVKAALTVVSQPGHPELEELEREVKFAALKEYITIASWVDTNTVCVGKFEWIAYDIAIDRDKSWIEDDPTDTLNRRGSLRGSLVSIINGHGAGQLRRIKTNGSDWIQLEPMPDGTANFVVDPGPISSYMIVAKDDAMLDKNGDPILDADGNFTDDPDIDYHRFPLCIHRAPVNINTASDKVLEALFMGINIQYGTPLAIGTDANANNAFNKWSTNDDRGFFGRIQTALGRKRVPQDSGQLVLNRPRPWSNDADFGYLNNFGGLGAPNFLTQGGVCNEAHELAYRIIVARQKDLINPGKDWIDPLTGEPTAASTSGLARGPFKSWDDLYFRVVKPWDDLRIKDARKLSVAHMIMAHFNSNTDILKFNPNIEWIDRWGRNFTSMEPVMHFTNDQPTILPVRAPMSYGPVPANAKTPLGFYFIRNMRYRVEEMIDKTDMNRSTTEFTMDSGGIYEILSEGEVDKGGQVVADRKMEALVQVYDVWRESTQRQFVHGTISQAARANKRGPSGDLTDAGKVVRDAENSTNPKALDTLPEPLAPLKYRFNNTYGGRLEECVDTAPRDARGNTKDISLPDVLANKILPASYDGQIVLAANTATLGADDTFLASFNGDLDTDTCRGNGREQAKTPLNEKIRVCDTISLLGLLNDKEIDLDPEAWHCFSINLSGTDTGTGYANPLSFLDNSDYGNSVSCRVGDLRADGIYTGILGTSCKDATLKYAYGRGPANMLATGKDGSGPPSTLTPQNYDPGNTRGCTVSMWFKPLWRSNDHLEHEFFNGGSNGLQWKSRGNKLCKNGFFQGTSNIGWPIPDGSLWALSENYNDDDITTTIHSGTDPGFGSNSALNPNQETPSFYTQPFRWSYVGMMMHYTSNVVVSGYGYAGFLHGGYPATVDILSRDVLRPFISTYRYPEGKNYRTETMWNIVDGSPLAYGCDLDGQPAAYPWEKHPNPKYTEGCFSINSVNETSQSLQVNQKYNGEILHLYRQQPTDSAYSVIDELKITKRAWTYDDAGAAMTVSRYYLPIDPKNRNQCPTFTSQTLLESLKAVKPGTGSAESVVVARVTWNVFTPRFLHEYIEPGSYSQKQYVDSATRSVPIRGPFDYACYNHDLDYDTDQGWKDPKLINPSSYLKVDRWSPVAGRQSHFSRGVEIEVLNDYNPINGYVKDVNGTLSTTSTFTDPDVFNSFLDPNNLSQLQRVMTDQLRYRVRFRYPIDTNVDPVAKGKNVDAATKNETVNPQIHFLLDTPVFDDISVTYLVAPRIISFRELTE